MSTVRRRKDSEAAQQVRFAANTIVGWFEGLTEHTGRVLINIPGTQWNVGTVIVKDGSGVQRTIRADRLHVKARQD